MIEIPLSDPHVAIATALITGCTTVIVTTIRGRRPGRRRLD